jgi:RNA polymerase sigma factor (sigma-70 family)
MDELYIKKVLHGDTEAFRYFVQQYSERAYHMALSILRSEFVAKDAIQESFLTAFNKLHTFGGRSKFSTWFFRIVINESLKMLKKEEAERTGTRTCSDLLFGEVEQSFNLLDEGQQRYFIHRALHGITPREAIALNLFYLQEYSLDEMCEVTGWTPGNSKVILHRARKSMYFELDRLLKSEKKLLY